MFAFSRASSSLLAKITEPLVPPAISERAVDRTNDNRIVANVEERRRIVSGVADVDGKRLFLYETRAERPKRDCVCALQKAIAFASRATAI